MYWRGRWKTPPRSEPRPDTRCCGGTRRRPVPYDDEVTEPRRWIVSWGVRRRKTGAVVDCRRSRLGKQLKKARYSRQKYSGDENPQENATSVTLSSVCCKS